MIIGKIFKKLCFVSILSLFSISAALATTTTPAYPKSLVNGVGNVTVYINYNSGAGFWESFILNATNNWMYTGWKNPIYITHVSSNVGSTVDVFKQNKNYWPNGLADSVLAETKLFVSGGGVADPYSTDWKYAEIHINHDNFIKPSFTNDQALGTIIHEFGHAFGLAHNNSNQNSIMCQLGYGRQVQRVQKIDNDAIVNKY